ncbi:MAG: AMP-binding protein [Clostridiaceae bacterium]
MQSNVLEYLESTVKRVPDKIAFANEKEGITFNQLYNRGRAIGTFLYKKGIYKQPVVVFMKKHPNTVSAFLGALYGGDFYVPIDEEMPLFRIELILKSLNPKAVICDISSNNIMGKIDCNCSVYMYDEIIRTSIEDDVISNIRRSSIDTDPMYVVFTSGSTGIPKGVIGCHRAVIDYIDNLSEVLKTNQETVFGNQAPLYFDACLREIYITLKFGAAAYIIPKSLFMFPLKLVEFLNEYKINTVCWVVPALTMISSFGTFDKIVPGNLNTIAFVSEVFPMKQFHIWKKTLPNAEFINLYGPTEITGVCCYFKADRDFREDEVLPIGRPFRNTDILLLGSNNKVPEKGELGEICVRGTSLTLGYYKAFDKTKEVFVQNPLNEAYPELIYRTGDLGKLNERGELLFVSRKDYQIKHMGHRIELGEIEVNTNMIDGIYGACCVYNRKKEKIVLFYTGNISSKEVTAELKKRLPRYMLPNYIQVLNTMPLTPNGKINRALLQENSNKKE